VYALGAHQLVDRETIFDHVVQLAAVGVFADIRRQHVLVSSQGGIRIIDFHLDDDWVELEERRARLPEVGAMLGLSIPFTEAKMAVLDW
jgi:hypothetical protein